MRILSIDGGGFLGLSSAAFLSELERHFGKKCCDSFDLFCGTSTGAIIALALANGLSAAEVVCHYRALGARVFPDRSGVVRWLRKWPRGAFWARYPGGPLSEALDGVFGDATLADITSRGKSVLVAAFNVSSGTPKIFKTDHSPNLTDHKHYRLADIALASSAAPIYFPLVDLAHPVSGLVERFCDGGVFANSPALLAYAEAVKELNVPPVEIDLLSVSTPRASLAERKAAENLRANRGLIRWGWNGRIAQVMIDGTSAASDEALSRLVGALGGGRGGYARVRLNAIDGLEMDVATPAAAESLMQIGVEEARRADRRNELARFFIEGSR